MKSPEKTDDEGAGSDDSSREGVVDKGHWTGWHEESTSSLQVAPGSPSTTPVSQPAEDEVQVTQPADNDDEVQSTPQVVL